MLKHTSRRQGRRRGANLVETAVVISLCFLFLFGIFEYGRLIMTRQLLENAAREGARYAVVHTYDKSTTDIQNKVTASLAGQGGQLSNVVITVVAANPSTGATLTDPATGQAVAWNDAQFGQAVMVRISGNYHPALPSLLHMSNVIPVQATSVMYSEAN